MWVQYNSVQVRNGRAKIGDFLEVINGIYSGKIFQLCQIYKGSYRGMIVKGEKGYPACLSLVCNKLDMTDPKILLKFSPV